MFAGNDIGIRKLPAYCASLSVLVAFLLALTLLLPETALGSVLQYTRLTSISGSVKLSYARYWGDTPEMSSFVQSYTLQSQGFVVDPRLVRFSLGTNLSYNMREGNNEDDTWLTGFNMSASMFNNINRNRGIKLWRYVPSPVVFGYSYNLADNYKQHNYNFGFSVVRQGFVRIMGPKGLIYYEAGRPQVQLDANRYRRKYNDESLNYNRNGNGNWNRNGNGNWNRNGNGNWNRNGNGNWNANRNGNWNANANAGLRSRIRPQRPLGFKFPRIFYNLYGMKIDFEGERGSTDSFVSMLRITTATKIRNKRGETTYSSRYTLTHNYYEENGEKTRVRLKISTLNEWKRLYLSNWYDKSYENDTDETQAASRLRWGDSIGEYTNYSIGAGVDYRDKEGNSATSYSLYGNIGSSVTKEIRLSPKLTSTSNINGSLSFSASKGDNDETNVVKGWRIGASEQLNSTHINWFPMHASLKTGYSQEGAPLSFSFAGNSRGLRKTTFHTNYSYYTILNSDKPRTVEQKANAEVKYRFRYNLDGYFKVEREWEESETGVDSGQTSWHAGMNWRPSYRSSVDTNTSHHINDNGSEKHAIESIYNQGLSRGSNLTASLEWIWENEFSERSEYFLLLYSWKYRRLHLRGEYGRTESSDGKVEHRIYMSAHRSFGRSLRM